MSLFNRYRTVFDTTLPQDPAQQAREILERAHRDQADAYAMTLAPGSTILEDTDGPTIARFRHLLPAALMQRGLALEQIVGGWRVVTAPLAPGRPLVVCRECGENWFRCEHGTGSPGVSVRW